MALNYSIIGKRIKEIRKKNHISQEKFSEIIDKTPSYISYIETGKKQLSLETLVDIANALKVTADVLLAHNLSYVDNPKDELGSILNGCTAYEKRIILDAAKSLKQILKDNGAPQEHY